jgi:hypothetical protein
MWLKRSYFRAVLATAALVMVTSTSVAFAAGGTGPFHPSNQPNIPTLTLTYNGTVVETFVAPAGINVINDVDLVWATPKSCVKNIQFPPVLLFWTNNGSLVGRPTLAPCRVNDFEASWDPNYGIVPRWPTGAPATGWTYNGKIVSVLAPPRGTNDFHLFWLNSGKLLKAYWTYNGKAVFRIPLKANVPVNDAHFALP